jgi:hypothetical protein
MKKLIVICVLIILIAPVRLRAQVSVTSDGSGADASAMFEVKSTEKGMLVPRMSTAQRTGITSPATGLIVYDTGTQSFWFRNITVWVEIRSGNITALTDADNDTKVMVEKSTDEDIIRFDIAGTQRMVFKQLPGALS